MGTTLTTLNVYGMNRSDLELLVSPTDLIRSQNPPWFGVLPSREEGHDQTQRLGKLAGKLTKQPGTAALLFYYFDDEMFCLSYYQGGRKRATCMNSQSWAKLGKKLNELFVSDAPSKAFRYASHCYGLEEQLDLLEETVGTALLELPDAEPRVVTQKSKTLSAIKAREALIRKRPNQVITAKKFEARRPELSHNGLQDVDEVITTRELAKMIKEAGIDFVNLPDEDFDPMLGESTGAGVIFGATGGVMEAALRTVYEVVTGQTLEKVDFEAVRGTEGIKEATVKVGDLDVHVAVAHGTANAAKLLDSVRSGEKTYHFIEVMGCPGGCVTGGGQPIVSAQKRMECDPKALRAAALYNEDANKPHRKSHENASVMALYKDYLGEPNSHLAHELLHTHYVERPKYKK